MVEKTNRNQVLSNQNRLAYLGLAHKRFGLETGNGGRAREISYRLNLVGTRLVIRIQLQLDWSDFPAHVMLGGKRESHCVAYL